MAVPKVVPAAVLVGLMGSGALVWSTSTATFTATTSTGTSSFTSGRVALANSSSTAALFSPSGLVPGATDTRCVDVDFTGDVASSVKLYATYGASSDLAQYLDFAVDQIPAGSACSPATTPVAPLYGGGTLQGLVSAHRDYATGAGTWTPSGPETRRYRFTYTLRDDNAAQGKQAQVALTWEARNT